MNETLLINYVALNMYNLQYVVSGLIQLNHGLCFSSTTWFETK